jgi:hypothetical protein
MSTRSNTGESFVSNLLMGTVIAASAFMLYAVVALQQPKPVTEVQAQAPATMEQVVVTAPRHVS